MVNKLYDLAVMQPQVPQSIRPTTRPSPPGRRTASPAELREAVPFGVPVIQRMEKVKELRLL